MDKYQADLMHIDDRLRGVARGIAYLREAKHFGLQEQHLRAIDVLVDHLKIIKTDIHDLGLRSISVAELLNLREVVFALPLGKRVMTGKRADGSICVMQPDEIVFDAVLRIDENADMYFDAQKAGIAKYDRRTGQWAQLNLTRDEKIKLCGSNYGY